MNRSWRRNRRDRRKNPAVERDCWRIKRGCHIVSGCIGIVQTVNSQPFDSAQGGAVNSQQSTSPDGATGIYITLNSQGQFMNCPYIETYRWI